MIGLGLGLVFLAPIELNIYDNETKIEIVFDKTPYTPYQDEYEKMLYPTVRITTGFATGSGVIIETTDKHGYTLILTAAHVVEDKTIVNIELYNSEIITGTVVITDTIKDLALIRVIRGIRDIRVKDIYSAHLAPKNYTPYIFTPVYSVGCSLGLAPRPSSGMITAISHQDTKTPSSSCLSAFVVDYWEVSSPILPGNSGGPVFDARTYEVIGIAVWVHTYQGQLITTMAGVVPINQIYEFLEKGKQGNCGSGDAGR